MAQPAGPSGRSSSCACLGGGFCCCRPSDWPNSLGRPTDDPPEIELTNPGGASSATASVLVLDPDVDCAPHQQTMMSSVAADVSVTANKSHHAHVHFYPLLESKDDDPPEGITHLKLGGGGCGVINVPVPRADSTNVDMIATLPANCHDHRDEDGIAV